MRVEPRTGVPYGKAFIGCIPALRDRANWVVILPMLSRQCMQGPRAVTAHGMTLLNQHPGARGAVQ